MANPRFYTWCEFGMQRAGRSDCWEIRDTEDYRKTHPKMPSRLTKGRADTLCARMNEDWYLFLGRDGKYTRVR